MHCARLPRKLLTLQPKGAVSRGRRLPLRGVAGVPEGQDTAGRWATQDGAEKGDAWARQWLGRLDELQNSGRGDREAARRLITQTLEERRGTGHTAVWRATLPLAQGRTCVLNTENSKNPPGDKEQEG